MYISVILTVSVILSQSSVTNALIPTACTDANSLENLICCPNTTDGVCGENATRGSCISLDFAAYSNETSDVRVNWPHFYTQICECNGNFAGYDCSRCEFGYYGSDCSQFQVLPRRPLRNLTDADWIELNDILRMTRTYNSGYSAVLEESLPGNASIETVPLTLYEYFVWLHHYAAKDTRNPVNRLDYAHDGPAFFTWHRFNNLWLEWQIQEMLQSNGREDYHTFRLPYWDWRSEVQTSSNGLSSDDLFSETRLGETRNISGFPRVFGTLIGSDGWDTICWRQLRQICDPRVSTGPLQRCPFIGTDPCRSSNPTWPSKQDAQNAIDSDIYDAPPFNMSSRNGFRTFVDVKFGDDIESCRNNQLCFCIPGGPDCSNPNPEIAVTLTLHTAVHLIPGFGDVNYNLSEGMQGQMGDVAASPNDPLFIFHHSMVDCIFEEWLLSHSDVEYPVHPLIQDGHRRDDYLRGFFPLYRNRDMFMTAENFGYSCRLEVVPDAEGTTEVPDAGDHFVTSPVLLLVSIIVAIATISNL